MEINRDGSDGDGVGDGGVNDGGGMSHDAAALHVAEAVDQRPHRPLHQRRRRESQEPQRRPYYLAPARVAAGAALHANRDAHHILVFIIPSTMYIVQHLKMEYKSKKDTIQKTTCAYI